MSRIREASSFRSIFGKLFYRIVKRSARRRLGKDIDPLKVMSNTPGILWGVSQLSESISKGGLIEPKLKSLVSVRAASLIGCMF